MTLAFDYNLRCRSVFLTPECTNRITSHEGMQSQQALTDLFSKWRTLFAKVCVPCLSLASTSCIDASNLSEESSVSSDYHSYFPCKIVGYPFPLVMQTIENGWYSFSVNLEKIFLAHLIHGFITYFHQTGESATHSKIIWQQVGFHLNIQWLTTMVIYFVQINVAQELTCHNSHLSVDVFVNIKYYIDPITACAILQGGYKDSFGQVTKCFLLHTYFVQWGHCINDTSRRLRDHISWWNLFLEMPCQSRFVRFLIIPLQFEREHDNILINV